MQLVQVEPGEHQVEVQALEGLELLREKVLVPARVQGEAVVGDDVRALLGLAEMRELDHRDGGHPELAGGEKTAEALLERLRGDPVWSKIWAVKHGRVHIVPTDLIGQPTPRVVEGLRLLAEHFHPELFAEDAPE